jgi:O-antigen/teichoic acid export membrane protein
MKRQFAKNLSTNWAVYLIAAVISFFLTPYIISKLGQAAFGVWILVGSFSGYLGLFDFGIGFAVVRFVARYQKTGETEKRNEVVATAFYIASLLALLVMAATIFIMANAAAFFDIPADLVGQSRTVIFLIGLSIALGFPLSIFSEALSGGLYRFDLFNTVSILMALLRTALTVAFLELGFGLTGLGVAALAASFIGYLWRMRTLFSLLPDLSIHPRLIKRSVLTRIGDYSFFSFLLVLSGRIAFYSDSFIVGFFRGIEAVAVFGIAVKLVEYLRQLVFTLTRLFVPVASRYDPDTDQETLRRIFYDGSRLSLLFSLPSSLVLFLWGGRLIRLWVGQDFGYSIVILQVLLIGHLLSFIQGIGGEILLGVGRHRFFALLSLIGAAVNIVLSIILVQKVGLIGVAWGTTIPLAALSVFYLPWATIRLVGGGLSGFLRRAIGPAITAAILPGLIIYLCVGEIDGFYSLAACLVPVGLVYLPSIYFLGLKRHERDKIRSIFCRKPKSFDLT